MTAWLATRGVVTLTVLGWLLLTVPKAVSIDVSPHVAIEPARALILVRVPRNPENRGLYVMADGYRSSFVQIDGEEAPAIFQMIWTAVPAGDYHIWAVVVSSTRTLARARTRLRVIGRGA